MKVRVAFTVTGPDLWSLDHAAQRVLLDVVGDLLNQEVRYEMEVGPAVEAEQEGPPALWRAHVVAHVRTSPEVLAVNAGGVISGGP